MKAGAMFHGGGLFVLAKGLNPVLRSLVLGGLDMEKTMLPGWVRTSFLEYVPSYGFLQPSFRIVQSSRLIRRLRSILPWRNVALNSKSTEMLRTMLNRFR